MQNYVIDRIADANGEVLYSATPAFACPDCGKGLDVVYDQNGGARESGLPRCFRVWLRSARGRDRPDGDHLAGIVAGLIAADVVRSQPVGFIRLRHDLIGAPQIVEVVDIGRAQINLQRLENSLRWHAQLGGPDTIDVGI